MAHRLLRRNQHLAAHVAALFLRRELIFEVDPCRAGFDHRLHQLENVECTAESRFGIRHDRRIPVRVLAAFHVIDLVGTL